jgi:hypothetical protein
MIGIGFQLVTVMSDAATLGMMARQTVAEMRADAKEAKAKSGSLY